MKDENKAKEQFMNELAETRHGIVELETSQGEPKRAEEALRRAEREKDAILNSLVEHVIHQDTEMKILWANRAACESAGLACNELVGRHCYEIWAQRREPCPDCPVVRARETGRPEELENSTPDGSAWFIRVYPARDQNGDIVGGIEVTLEITERKRAEEKVRKAAQRLQMIFDSVNDGLAIMDKGLTVKEVNKYRLEALGLNRDQVIGRKCYEAFQHRDKPCEICPVQPVFEKREPIRLEKSAVLKDGTVRYFDGQGTPIFDDAGNVAQVVSSMRDITERKRAEQVLHQERDRAQKYLNIAGVIFLAINVKEEVALMNQKGCEILGYEHGEMIGKNWFDNFLPARIRNEVKSGFQKLMAGEVEPVEYFENPVLGKSGEERMIAWHNTVLRDGEGNITGTLSSGEDITERKRAEEKLRESEETMRALVNAPTDSAMLIDTEGIIFVINEVGAKTFGKSVDELLGECVYDLLPPGVTESRKAWDDEVVRSGKPVRFEDEHGGRIFDTLVYPVLDARAEVKRLAIFTSDITKRKQVEQELWESQEFSSSLLSNAPNPILVVNPGTSVRYANPALEKLTGFSTSELIGKKAPYPWWIEETIEKDSQNLREAMLKGAQSREALFQKKDGERFWVGIDSTAITHHGQLQYYLSNWVDITERKQAEEALRVSEEKYRTILENIEDGYYEVDIAGNFTFFNDSMRRILGYPEGELMGMNYRQYMDDENAKKAYQTFDGVYRTGEPAEAFGREVITKEGTRKFVEASVSLIRDSQGEPAGFRGIVRDITERKRVEQGLIRLSNAVSMSTDSIVISDLEGKIIDVNEASLEAYGTKDKKDLVGMDSLDLIAPEEREEALKDMKEVLEKGYVKGREYHVITKDGGRIPVETSVAIMKGADGKPIGFVAVSRDISERKKAEEATQASLKEKEVLLDEIHHRVKNNLQVISSLLKLQSRDIKDEHYAEMLKESQSRVNAMALIHEKLYQSPDLARIDFGEYIKGLAGALFRSHGSDAARIALKTEVEGIMLGANHAMPCGLIVNELVSNSLKHAFPKGREGEIKIAMRPTAENELELVVSDNGSGVPEDLDFRNVESLGLQLVTILAEDQLGGQIELDRTGGTRFQIRFGVAE